MKNRFPLLGLILLLLISLEARADQTTNGIVTLTLPDGSVYTGGIKTGLFNGKGVRIYPSGEKYEGEYADGLASGKGVLSLRNGDRYEGQFKRDLFNGTGILIRANHDRYEGEFKDGNFEGNGVFSGFDGFKAKGQFKAGLLHGTGFCVYASGTKMKGEFKDGRLDGMGRIQFADGETREGHFKDGKLNGDGVVVVPFGRRYEGYFKDGKLINERTSAYSSGNSLWDVLTGRAPKFAATSMGKTSFWLPFLLVLSVFFNIMQARSQRSKNWFQPQLAEKPPPDYSGVLNDTERFEKIAVLDNEVQAEALDALLAERGIPHEMKSYRDSAMDGIYLSRGWGHVSAPKTHAAAVLQALKDLTTLPDADTSA